MKTIDHWLAEPCSDLVPHTRHVIDLVDTAAASVYVAVCPGSPIPQPDPAAGVTLET